ncbi:MULTISPECIES: erythromycin esterase family protein [Nostoc]|uniref:Erythromycin esterase family protein n=2 Tax=Nostoc TaxID=1177 RepID=A0ABR8IEH8_9NOSO|nr:MULTISPECIES: erythromycin esterase family protein [Nostoc]MBD2564417.1 erythromycin esterase family protein [Nostoc linckia FACHB-391]MBD2649232.1 erythromycin esterase family protein [Nostoc foliaceum FACHB-393]
MVDATITNLVDVVRESAYRLTGAAADYDPLMNLIGDARIVLIGEATHGTHEFYKQRAEITKRLIQEKGFTAVAVEADWPDAYRVNRYVQDASEDPTPAEALSGFQRFPTWMWRNTDMLNFLNWLREYNDAIPENAVKVGFYGLDLYSMYASIEVVLEYLDQVDPETAQRARYRYSCFEHLGEDAQTYGYATSFGLTKSCEEEVVNVLEELQRRAAEYIQKDGEGAADELFYALQNARLVKNAEAYYRSMFQGRVSSWNIRDRHMAEMLDQLVAHFEQQGKPSKVVVWEHNSHLGDARATDMEVMGEVNVGQLVRDRYGDDAVLIGFTTYTGTVTAASNWGGTAELKLVRPALPGSYEALFHQTGVPQFLLLLKDNNPAITGLREAQLERAIGVIYQPETERISHYFYARLPDQFGAVIHIDDTKGVQPLDRTAYSDMEEAPETFPFAV